MTSAKPPAPVAEFLTKEEAEARDKLSKGQVDHAVVTRDPWEATLRDLANRPGTQVRVPRSPQLRKNQVVDAFLDAFQLIGGTARLAIWADENPTEFYRLYGKLLPKPVEQEVKHEGGMKIVHVLPRGKLDE